MYCRINCPNILELSVKFASQICHENTNKPLDGAYLADFSINTTMGDIRVFGSLLVAALDFMREK